MKTIGIICEYNPFHLGHAGHIQKTRNIFGDEECAVIGVMSGNFVQRGEFAVFNKHARAEAAVSCGVDLVLELPTPYALTSAEGFAEAGVSILENTGVCDYISFGSESGSLEPLMQVACALNSKDANILTKKWLDSGLSYATAKQAATDEILGSGSNALKSPNNMLGIEYIIALQTMNSSIKPITVSRTTPYSALAIREAMLGESGLHEYDFFEQIPKEAAEIYKNEILNGRGPVSIKHCETAILSRLRAYENYHKLSGASEGLEHRFEKYAKNEPTIDSILQKVKTKRYVMSRLRRMMLCAGLNITKDDVKKPPPYIRVLAMNETGMKLLKTMRKKSKLPIITKPASVLKFGADVSRVFYRESEFTDMYVLAYTDENQRTGGTEWLKSPRVIKGKR